MVTVNEPLLASRLRAMEKAPLRMEVLEWVTVMLNYCQFSHIATRGWGADYSLDRVGIARRERPVDDIG